MVPIFAHEVTPPIRHEVVEKLARKIDLETGAIEVKRTSRLRPLGLCYWNVASVVKESGGKIALGWAVTWWPGLYAVAVHHAVWEQPSGRLIDVTEPQPFDKRSNHTVFLRDERIAISLDRPPAIENVFVPLADVPALQAYLFAYQTEQACVRSLLEMNWQFGDRCEQQHAMAAGKKQPVAQQVTIPAEHTAHYQMLIREVGVARRDMGAAIKALIAHVSDPM